MRKNDFHETKNLNIKALIEKVRISKVELSDLIMDKNIGKLKDLRSVSKKRRDIAQLQTVLRQKQLLEQLESRIKVRESSSKIKNENESKDSEKEKPKRLAKNFKEKEERD